MLTDNGSINALVALDVVNTHGFDFPQTGTNGAMILAITGSALITLALASVFLFVIMPGFKNRKEENQA